MEVEAVESALVNIATESWRITKVFERQLNKMDATEQGRYRNQFRWFLKKVEENLLDTDFTIVNVEGQVFDPGMAATPINLDEFEAGDRLVVDQMMEPIILRQGSVVRSGTVVLRKGI